MNKFHAAAWLAVTLGTTQIAHAADKGLYMGVGVGSITSSVSAEVVDGLSKDFDGKDAAYKVLLGVRPLNWLAAEVNYLDLGKPESQAFAVDSTGFSGSAVLFANLGSSVEAFAKGGVVNWKSNITEGSRIFKEKGTDPVYGGGLIIRVLSMSIRAEYEHFDMDVDSNLLSLGLTWTFL